MRRGGASNTHGSCSPPVSTITTPEWGEERKLEERSRLVGEACQVMLDGLDAEGPA
jgi:hypothetical protein